MKIKTLFKSYHRWIQNNYARVNREPYSKVVEATHSDAACWCLLGAVKRCYPTEKEQIDIKQKIAASILILFPERVANAEPSSSGDVIVTFNDRHNTNFSDVRKVVNHAKV